MRKLFTQFTQNNHQAYGWIRQTNKVIDKSGNYSFYILSLFYDVNTYTDDTEIQEYLNQIHNLSVLDIISNNNENCYYRSEIIVTDESMFYFKLAFDWTFPVMRTKFEENIFSLIEKHENMDIYYDVIRKEGVD